MTSSKISAYKFDDEGRLTTVHLPNGATAMFDYDAAGNRVSVVEVPATTPAECCPPTVAELPKRQCGDFSNEVMVVLLSNGRLVGWGDNTTGANANSIITGTSAPIQDVLFSPATTMPPFDATIVDWALTNANLYVVFSNGWCYSAGRSEFGQLGHGDLTARPFLKRIEYFVTNSISIEKVWACGSYFTSYGGGNAFFRATDRKIYAVGQNVWGNLGNGVPGTPNSTNQQTPVLISTLPSTTGSYVLEIVISAVSNAFSTFARCNDGKLLVAGFNGRGNLGTGNVTNQLSGFVSAKKTGSVDITNCVSVSGSGGYDGSSAVGNHTIIVDTAGDAWATGDNWAGQLGIDNFTNQTLFTKCLGLSNVTEAKAAGGLYGYSYALDAAGTLYTFGYNGVNNLFRNNTTNVKLPSAATFTPGAVSKVFLPREDVLTTNSQMIVLTTSGILAYAGSNNGQQGVANDVAPGAYKYIPTPRQLLDGTEDIADVFVHGLSVNQRWFIRTTEGVLYASGSNVDSICTGGVASNVPAANFAWSKISFVK